MNLEQITLKGATADPASGARPLALAAGKDLVARVVSAPLAGGRGLISLAGVILEARVPAGLASGQILQLRVTRADAQELVVRIVHDAAEHPDQQASSRLAGELALRGDGDLLRVALGLADGPLWLPGGAAATITIEPEDEAESGSAGGGGEAAFTLHCPEVGAIEVRLRMAAGGVRAGVVAPAGRVADQADTALPDLVAALERATGRPAAAAVQRRPDSDPAPTPPGGAFDGYA
jgi:flagellar hook-length control protein FliK